MAPRRCWAARAYGVLGDYKNEASAWEAAAAANPTSVAAYKCLAASPYASKEPNKGDLAAAKVQSLVSKAQRSLVKVQIQQAKTNPQIAQQC